MSYIKSANFISADPSWENAVPIFKKEFSTKGDVARAELEISALGVYEARLNGERIGDFVLAPGWTEYGSRLQYQIYDITEMLADSNTVTVGVGHGWYGSHVGFSKYPLGKYPALIAAIKILYTDGREELIPTDESWQTARSETISSDIYDGEITDAKKTHFEIVHNAFRFVVPKAKNIYSEPILAETL